MQILSLKIHTVVLLVGPSGSGKTYFSKTHLIPQLKGAETLNKYNGGCRGLENIQYLGSDDIRRELLGDAHYHKNNHHMMAVSEQAFDLLYKKLELVTSYPVNADFVIVDTTGLNLEFRNKVTSIAKNANYNTVCIPFLYKERDEYFKHVDNPNRMVMSSQINRYHRETLSELRKKDFDSYFYIKHKDFNDIEIQVEDEKVYYSHFLSDHLEYPVIGDVHGCYDELLALLGKLNFKIEDGKVVEKPSHKIPIIVGDYIDGDLDGVEKIINFLYDNQEHFKLIIGNHEHFVYKYHKNLLGMESLPSQEFLDAHFPTIQLLKEKPDIAEKFCTLKEMSKEFFIGSNFIVTHAPCEDRCLGKLKAIKFQRNFRYPHRDENESLVDFTKRFEDSLSFLKATAATNKPFHIFGHCRSAKIIRVKNKVGIDTGCIQGNFLTAATVVGGRIFYESVGSTKAKSEELPNIFASRKDASTVILPDVDLSELDFKDLTRIRLAVKNKINYISGTMSPSDKDKDRCQLETIENALDYYRSHGVTELCIQPKYMGSRVELMLNCKDLSKSYTSTRRGYLVNFVDMNEAYERILPKIKPISNRYGFEWVYLDCELMPWYVLGKGLITKSYSPVKEGIKSEIALLKETGFESRLKDLMDEYDTSEYAKLHSTLPKKTLYKQLTHHKCANYEAIHSFQWIPLEKQDEFFSVYERQLDLFAAEGETNFKPFSILKGIYPDNSEMLFSDMSASEQFNLVSEDECVVVDLNQDDAISKAKDFFDGIVKRELEGVVVKSEQYIKDVAPYLKVRNPQYLSIIYGMDYTYPFKYEKLVQQKRIARKLRASITEFEYGRRLLEIPRSEISMENKEYINLFAKLIFEHKRENTFDPRL